MKAKALYILTAVAKNQVEYRLMEGNSLDDLKAFADGLAAAIGSKVTIYTDALKVVYVAPAEEPQLALTLYIT